MPRPGVDVLIVDDATAGGPDFQTGRAFFVAETERGPTAPVELTSAGAFARTYGERAGQAPIYDSVAAFFAEGGASLIFARAVGANAATATNAVFGGLTVDATSPGAWANDVTVRTEAVATLMEVTLASAMVNGGGAPDPALQAEVPEGSVSEVRAWVGNDPDRARAALAVEAGADSPRASLQDAIGTFAGGSPVVIVVTEGGEDVERSTPVTTGQDAMDWADAVSSRVTFSGAGDATLPTAGTAAVALAGGTDVATDADDYTTAMGRFHSGYGPGQVCAPGVTDADIQGAIADHCVGFERVGIVDLPDDPDATVLAGAVAALYGHAGARYVLAVGPPALYPVGTASGAVGVVPYSAIQAGMVARVDAQGNPALPAAGVLGVSSGALGLTQDYTQEDRTTLNDLGVTLAREVYGSVRTYGYRTAAGPAEGNWLFFGESRTVMAIAHESALAAENYLFRPIDGRGHVFSALAKDLVAICARYYALDALYGAGDNDAYRVDVGGTVNTPDTIARGEIHAVVKVKTSRDAEWVVVSITKVPPDRAL